MKRPYISILGHLEKWQATKLWNSKLTSHVPENMGLANGLVVGGVFWPWMVSNAIAIAGNGRPFIKFYSLQSLPVTCLARAPVRRSPRTKRIFVGLDIRSASKFCSLCSTRMIVLLFPTPSPNSLLRKGLQGSIRTSDFQVLAFERLAVR